MPGAQERLAALPWILGALIVTSCVHEAGHAWAAWRLGDRREDIRRRRHPFTWRHISLPFTIILPSILLVTSGMMIGGAKPVMVSTRAIDPWRMVLVAFAGPAGNFFTGVLQMALVVGLLHAGEISSFDEYYHYLVFGCALSFFLGFLNLIPIPPFDGSRIVAAFMPERVRGFYYSLSIPCIVVLFVAFFYVGRYHPEQLAFIGDFFSATVPGWTRQLHELIQ